MVERAFGWQLMVRDFRQPWGIEHFHERKKCPSVRQLWPITTRKPHGTGLRELLMNHERPYGFKLQPKECIGFNDFPPGTYDCLEVFWVVVRKLNNFPKLARNQIKPQPIFVQN